MQLDEVTISRIITKSFLESFQRAMDGEVAMEILRQPAISQ